ncbi:MAG: hypothetical protein ACRDF0_08770 [Candidatus Limnocylindria bacterium]
MSASEPVQRVVALLEGAGYEAIEQPRPIGGIPFEFAAMLAGVGSLDLIAVIDVDTESDRGRLRGRVEGLARALDLVRSRRSLTLVLVGVRPEPELVQALARVGRVLLTTAPPGDEGEVEMSDTLAVLLPLQIAADPESAAESWAAARTSIAAAYPAEAKGVLAAASADAAAVEVALGELLAEPLRAVSPDDEDAAR